MVDTSFTFKYWGKDGTPQGIGSPTSICHWENMLIRASVCVSSSMLADSSITVI